MSLKKIEQVKNSKWFSIWDLVVFGVIIITAVALILAFTLGRDKSKFGGFSVSFRGETVLTYEFGNDKPPSVLNGEYIEVKMEDNGNYTVRFTNGDGGYNVIYVDAAARTVDVTDSNCSSHKDCVHTAKLKNNSSPPIICTVHGLTVAPLKFVDNGNIPI